MDKLPYPIIRRQRRSLVLADGHQAAVPPAPVQTAPEPPATEPLKTPDAKPSVQDESY